ncbi:E3 SUMO-protein ligase ZBED1-like [Trachinotus anak]|uniref:E3 SUMO-protein ligase ZBED1-like n=1 Tax=Trachinotus anak TaxID=443729 RepID=UPI0039F228CD
MNLERRGRAPRRSYRGKSLQPPRRDQNRRSRAFESLLKMIVSNLQPLEITTGAQFVDFVRALNSTVEIPSKAEIRPQLLSVYRKMEEELRRSLSSADNVVLTCELWSSRPEDSYLTVGCHFVDRYGNLKSHMLKTTCLFGDKSPANIQKQLSAVMEAWGVKEKVHSVVRAGMPQMKNVKVKWTDMPCFADTLDEVFQDLKRNDELSHILRKCQNIVRFFKDDSEAEEKLREIQHKLNGPQDELVMYSGDQWSAWLDMLQHLHQQYQAIVMVLDEKDKADLILKTEDKDKLKNIISALEPLKEATAKMKSQGFETISVMLPLLTTLMNKLEEKGRNNDVAQMLLLKCRKEFGDVNNHQLALSTFLDPRYKNWLTNKNKEQAMDKIMKELTAGQICSPAQTSKWKDLLDRYMAYDPNSEKSNPLAWWRNTGKTHFSELSQLAVKKLGVVSTAVPLERAFSRAGDQFCSLRSSIEPENLNMILFLNSNWS